MADSDWDRIYGVALSIAGREDDAEAAIEEALQNAAAPSGLLLSVAAAAHRRLRQRVPHHEHLALDDVVPPTTGDDRHFDALDDWSTRTGEWTEDGGRQAVLSAMDGLPPEYRTALVLHDVARASTRDAGAVLDIDVAAVKSYVHRARLFVRMRLSEYFARSNAA